MKQHVDRHVGNKAMKHEERCPFFSEILSSPFGLFIRNFVVIQLLG